MVEEGLVAAMGEGGLHSGPLFIVSVVISTMTSFPPKDMTGHTTQPSTILNAPFEAM